MNIGEYEDTVAEKDPSQVQSNTFCYCSSSRKGKKGFLRGIKVGVACIVILLEHMLMEIHSIYMGMHCGAHVCGKLVQAYCLCRIPIGIKPGQLPVVNLGHKCTKHERKHVRGTFTQQLSELAKEKRKAHHCKTLAFLIYTPNLYLDWKRKSSCIFPFEVSDCSSWWSFICHWGQRAG